MSSEPPPSVHLRPVRRSPNYARFIITGSLLGIIAGLILGARGESGTYSNSTAMLLLAAILGGLGALLFAGIAVVLDRAPREGPSADSGSRESGTGVSD